MRIGILTFHRAYNYGAILQCYALQETLKNKGHEVFVINYKQPFIDNIYKPFRFIYWLKALLRLRPLAVIYPFGIITRIKRKTNFVYFRNEYLQCTDDCMPSNIPGDFDRIIIGSDQLWNSKLTGGIDAVYWGNFKRVTNCKLLTYAMSTSINDLKSIANSYITRSIKNFSFLSVREEALSQYFQEEFGIKTETVLDPTLIASPDIWDRFINKKYEKIKYILIYHAGRNYKGNPNFLKEKAEYLAKELDCRIIDLSSGKYKPEDFVSLFKYASYVVTTSFHAVAFSIIFNRPMYAYKLNDGHDSRYENILKAIHADKMLVDVDFIPCVDYPDYSAINSNLQALKLKSLNYLKYACS